MQRLFSTFAGGWPGLGLFLLRFVTAGVLFHFAIALIGQPQPFSVALPQILGALTGMLLLAGFSTPVAGMLVAVVEIWAAGVGAGDPLIHFVLATLGITLAMIGPGAWSVDAKLFGRKHIEPPHL